MTTSSPISTGDIIAAQGSQHEPAAFQSKLIRGLSAALLRDPPRPCLLNAPTGAGKTFVMTQVLARVCDEQPTLWLWFVPFLNLVQQTEDALASSSTGLTPVMLHRARNLTPHSGMVVLSTAQAVGRKKDRDAQYTLGDDDTQRSLNHWIAQARADDLNIGLVVDEAHIGLDSVTEFGKFADWLKPDYLLMATATPRDDKLLAFIGQSGLGAYESFPVARADVVEARLNKRYIESVVYDLRESVQTITDLRATVLRQAWRRNQRLKRELARLGVPLTPLLLVQVSNGARAVDEAEADLVNLCKVPLGVIGKHSADVPDHVMMAAIANDPSKEVLIFKQSAGTGFDAPRAFVLASLKSVNDADFALQFIGRVMRVSPAIRAAFAKPVAIPAALDTAYIYLANAQAQQGYEQAVQASQRIQSQLEGQTEALTMRRTRDGGTHYSNRSTLGQGITDYRLGFGLTGEDDEAGYVNDADEFALDGGQGELLSASGRSGNQAAAQGVFPPFEDDDLDDHVLDEATATAPRCNAKPKITHRAELMDSLAQSRIAVYPLRRELLGDSLALQREKQPELDARSGLLETVAARLDLPEELRKSAVRAALDRLKESEVHTELTTGERSEQEVLIITNRNALAEQATELLFEHFGEDEEDAQAVVRVLASRLLGELNEAFETQDEDERPTPQAFNRLARDAAFWVIRKEIGALSEMMQALLAQQTTVENAATLPDLMVFPSDLPLNHSRKNIYGVLPPTQADLDRVDASLSNEERRLFADNVHSMSDATLKTGKYDGSVKLNGFERQLAQALDQAEFVTWWHRNPDRKDYAVRIVRAEHSNYFYPDFVVCMSHFPSDAAIIRLIETKDNTKDAARKAQREPKVYGKVLFITQDVDRLKIIKDDGSLGDVVDMANLSRVREWMRQTKPIAF
jgi:type III restriction enzyme